MTPGQDPKKKGFAITRWQVSARGAVAHLRVGVQARTICGQTISASGKPVAVTAVTPACQDCSRVLGAVKRDIAEERAEGE